METKLYLCVNPDGTELATNDEPVRVSDHALKHVPENYRKTHPLEYYYPDQWADCVTDGDYGYYGYYYSFDGIELPKGTIEKLTGEKLSFDDEYIIYE